MSVRILQEILKISLCVQHKSSGLSHLSFLIAYPPVEFFTFQAEEIISGLQDAAFGCYGTCCVDVVAGDHAYGDPGTLALFNSIRDLIERNPGQTGRRLKLALKGKI